jgi:Met-zincin/Domain of unknown function (DUF5117)/Domain of unknown function (DUF5118)
MNFRLRSVPAVRLALIAAGVIGLSGCATVAPQPAAAPAATAAATAVANAATEAAAKVTDPKAAAGAQAVAAAARGSAPAAAAAAAGGPPAPKPFAEVIKDAKEEKGFFTTWRKDDKVWLEIPEEMWERPFFFSVNVTHSIGDAGLFGNQMGGFLAAGRGQYFASFKKFGPTGVQLIARNVSYAADKDAPIRHAVERSFSDSLIGSATLASAPHPERKSVLIEANALFINDFPMAAQQLEQTFRQPYSFDAKNSSIEKVRNSETETGFNVRGHYQLNRLSIPSLTSPPPPGAPVPSFPATLPDVRSLFMGYYYGFSKLPTPMRPREADPRVGYFTTNVNDFSNPDKREPKTRYIQRWRLEKKDPSAAVSEPKEPITYWLDKNIPTAYRKAVTDGILEWNKAYEKIGFKNALVVKQQGDNDDMDTSATRFASIRWVAGNNIPFGARGPSKVDPRTGEILDADIEMNEDMTRLYSARVSEDPPRPVGAGLIRNSGNLCTYADGKLTEAAFALDLLVARGDFEYGSAQAEAWIMDAIKDITAHEVGHTLGLRHNFKASTSITPEQLRDPKFGADVGISSSVMDYNALNIATKDERQGQYSMVTVGPYDIWAVEYGYKETTPETEKSELAKTLSRSNEPLLAYATDEDAGLGPIAEGIDPDVNRADLSSDPLGFYEKRFTIIRELWDRVQSRELPAGTKYEQLRRNFQRGFLLMGQVTELTAKYVGGVNVLRDVAGSGRQPITPVDAEKQRRALNLLTKNLFTVDAFKFKPEFLGKLAPDFDARSDSLFDDDIGIPMPQPIDSSVAGRVFAVQRATLGQLMRDSVAARLVVAPEKLSDSSKALGLPELYGTLQKAIWSELSTGASISMMRRNLQREHVRLLAEAVARPSPRAPADARSLQREYASELLALLRKSSGKPGAAIETRAHLNESIALLDAALKAQIAKVIG